MVAARGMGQPAEKVWVAKGHAPKFHEDRAIDQLMAMVTALTAEVAILRERIDTHERVAERHRLYRREDIESYQPDPAAAKERSAARQRLLKKVYRVLKEDLARYQVTPDNTELMKTLSEINDG
ncbi:MAG: hypothetical protein FJX59_12485 [Alphaproteobacteria bacterium]|nr:hypothetical protein [Alphaproteobacteria bacterium]